MSPQRGGTPALQAVELLAPLVVRPAEEHRVDYAAILALGRLKVALGHKPVRLARHENQFLEHTLYLFLDVLPNCYGASRGVSATAAC